MLLAQFSDPHIGARHAHLPHGSAPEDTLGRAVAALLAGSVPPDGLVISGDLVERGTREEYAEVRRLLAPLACPVYLMAGNHDDRSALRAAFPEHGYLHAGEFIQYAFDAADWRVIVLDSLDPGRSSGRLCAARVTWLEEALADAGERDVMLFVHHQPFETGVTHVDASRLLGAEALAGVVRAHGRVGRIVCGHVHRAMQATWAGVPVTTCPSAFFQFLPDFRDNSRYAPGAEAPGYQLHRFAGRELVSHTIAVA